MVAPIHNESETVDLLGLIKLLAADWLIFVSSLVVFTVLAAYYAISLPDVFKSETLLAPVVNQNNPSNTNSLIDQISGVPGIGRLGVSSRGVSETARALAVLESRAFLGSFIRNHDLMVPLMATRPVAQDGTVEIDPTKYDIATENWLVENGAGELAPPTDGEVYEAFSQLFFVSHDIDRGFVTIAIEWFDPVQIADWTNWLVEDLNNHIKQEDLREAEKAIEYLESQVQNTQLVDMRNVFYNLIESQMQTLMLADVREQYALQVIDPAVIPEEKVRPDRFLILLLGFALGFVVALAIVVFKRLSFQG